jgi:hypothetical protein
MTNGTRDRNGRWIFDELIEATFTERPDGMVDFHFKASPERGAVIEEAIENMADALPRAADTTDEQHHCDAFIEIWRRHGDELEEEAELAADAMAYIRRVDVEARTEVREGRRAVSFTDATILRLGRPTG